MTAAHSDPPDFVHDITIRVSRARLHAFLCDLHNYVPLHPLIASIDEIEPSVELPSARRYRVVDRIPLGPFKLRTVYVAALDPVSDVEVRGHAWQSPGVRLVTIYALNSLDDGGATRLEERVFVEAPLGLRRFVTWQARKSHEVTLRRMKDLLESDRSPG